MNSGLSEAAVSDSKRVRSFRRAITKAIPIRPDDRATRERFAQLPLPSQLVHYLEWLQRFVPPRPREVVIETPMDGHPRWPELKDCLEELLAKVRTGADVNRHLGERIARGYSPAASGLWDDRDFLLTVTGYRHFHLGRGERTRGGFTERQNDVLFADISSDRFVALGIFDHSVFRDPSCGPQTADQRRFWSMHENRRSRQVPPGAVYFDVGITTSGRCIGLVNLADAYARQIHQLDPLLDDRAFVAQLYEECPRDVPRRPKFSWAFRDLDLALLERTGRSAFIIPKAAGVARHMED